MTKRGARWARALTASLVVIVLAAAASARAQVAEALTLGLEHDEGSACLSAERLASALAARLGTPVSTTSDDTGLAVSVGVRTLGARRFAVVIDSHDRANGASGRRELTIDDSCEALTAPLSLVIALMVGRETAPQPQPFEGQAVAPEAAPAPAPVPETAPAATTTTTTATTTTPVRSGAEPRPPRFELGLGGGADLGMLPRHVPVVQLAGRVGWVPAITRERGTPLLVELAVDLWPPQVFQRGATELRMVGATIGSAVCSAWSYGDVSFEPCAGLWLRPLHGSAPGSAVDSDWFLLSGWSARATVRLALAAPWSVFVGAQAVVPFGPTRLVLVESMESRVARVVSDGPFFNAPVRDPRTATARRVVLHQLPSLGAVLVAGVRVSLGS